MRDRFVNDGRFPECVQHLGRIQPPILISVHRSNAGTIKSIAWYHVISDVYAPISGLSLSSNIFESFSFLGYRFIAREDELAPAQ